MSQLYLMIFVGLCCVVNYASTFSFNSTHHVYMYDGTECYKGKNPVIQNGVPLCSHPSYPREQLMKNDVPLRSAQSIVDRCKISVYFDDKTSAAYRHQFATCLVHLGNMTSEGIYVDPYAVMRLIRELDSERFQQEDANDAVFSALATCSFMTMTNDLNENIKRFFDCAIIYERRIHIHILPID